MQQRNDRAVVRKRYACLFTMCMCAGPATAVGEPDNASTKPQLIVEESTVYYSVHARNLEELISQLHVPDAGEQGRKAHGLTRSDLRLDGELTQASEGCQMSGYTIRLVLRMDLPRWDESMPMPRSLAEKWEEINDAIVRHERQHRQHALDGAARLLQALSTLESDRRCLHTSQAIRSAVQRMEAWRDLQDRLLDERPVLIRFKQ